MRGPGGVARFVYAGGFDVRVASRASASAGPPGWRRWGRRRSPRAVFPRLPIALLQVLPGRAQSAEGARSPLVALNAELDATSPEHSGASFIMDESASRSPMRTGGASQESMSVDRFHLNAAGYAFSPVDPGKTAGAVGTCSVRLDRAPEERSTMNRPPSCLPPFSCSAAVVDSSPRKTPRRRSTSRFSMRASPTPRARRTSRTSFRRRSPEVGTVELK